MMDAMTAWVGGAVRGVVVLVVAFAVGWFLGGRPWDLEFTEVGLWVLVVAIVPAVWARADSRRHGTVATEWIWAHAAAWAAAGVLVSTLLSGWRMRYVLLAACLATACVAVPAWSSVRIGARPRDPAVGAQRPLPVVAMTLVTTGGVGVFLLPPIVALGFGAQTAWTGCFLECQEPRHLAAVGWLAVAGVFLVDVVLWALASWRRFPGRLTCAAAIPLVLYAVTAYLLP